MRTSESVTKYMTRSKDLIKFNPHTDIQEATNILLTRRISGAPVVDKNGDLVGILSEKDCLHLLIDGMYNQRPVGSGQVSEYMSKDIATLDASKTIEEAAHAFLQSSFRRFPVIHNGKLLGQLSRRDVLKAIVKRKPAIKHTPSSWKVRAPA